MILFKVNQGVITVMNVCRETKSGWRKLNNGFINRRVMGLIPSLTDSYYTTDIEQAKRWRLAIITRMEELIQVSRASLHDIEFWQYELDSDESSIPKPRQL